MKKSRIIIQDTTTMERLLETYTKEQKEIFYKMCNEFLKTILLKEENNDESTDQ